MLKKLLAASVLVATAAAAETYTIAGKPHGAVRFKVEGPIDDVNGETKQLSGSLELDPANLAATRGVVAVDLSLLRTGIDERDRDMRVEFLQTNRFPFALLSLEKIDRPTAAALEPDKTVEGEAVGSFEVHGVRRQLKFNVKLAMTADRRVRASGAFEVPFADYNITRPQRLFLKLGEVADVTFEAVFEPKATAAAPVAEGAKPPDAPTVASVQPASVKAKARPARKPKPQLAITYLFTGDEPKAKGERLFHQADIGGPGNKVTCGHCHAKADERAGLKQADGYARAAHTLYNAAQRAKWWNGFAPNVGKASSICQKMFMKGQGLTPEQEQALQAFVEAISPDSTFELDYRVAWRTYESAIRDPTGGDPIRGKALADVYCMTCHLDGRVGPSWAPGLYEPDWVVRRVRHLEGHANRQMPAFTIDRLPDSDLRDIVTYLTSPKVAPPVFNRKRVPAAAAGSR